MSEKFQSLKSEVINIDLGITTLVTNRVLTMSYFLTTHLCNRRKKWTFDPHCHGWYVKRKHGITITYIPLIVSRVVYHERLV